jgi:proton-dependent oligopeptide transporter, POT family
VPGVVLHEWRMSANTDDTAFFGHPRGLGVLCATQLWERFSFYGMQALLMFYMTQDLLRGDKASHVWGLGAYRHGLEALFGPMTNLGFAAETYGLYAGFVYVMPLLGAWIADRVLGKTRTICAGAVLMAAGHLAMAVVPLFLVALSLLILGGGCVIGNLSSQVGDLYTADDARRTRAFAVFLIASNVGSLLSPLIAGTLGERVGWDWGFGSAGIGMLVGAATYLSSHRHLVLRVAPVDRTHLPPLDAHDRRRICGILLAFVPYILVNAAFQQCYALMYVWADTAVDHTVMGHVMPITWFNFFDGAMAMGTIALSARAWRRAAARGREPHDVTKLGIGCAGVALAFVYAALVALRPGITWTALLPIYLMIDFAGAWFEPPTGALTSRYAPARLSATMMGLFKLAMAMAFFLLGWLGQFFEPLGAVRYWLMTAGVAASGAVLVLLFGRAVIGLLEREPASPATAELAMVEAETQIHAWPSPD